MKTEIIVEVGNTHEGSLGIAKSFVDMAISTGAKFVKFQMHLAHFEGMPNEPFRKKFSDQDENRQDYWKRTGFTENQWRNLIDYVVDREMEFLCTPFSVEAAKWLFSNNAIKRWKIGSGDAANFPLIDFLVSTRLPLIISTGLISWDEILRLQFRLKQMGAWSRTTLLHCVSKYPTLLDQVAFNIFNDLKSLECNVGISDHSGNVNTGLFAIASGATILEVHLTPHELFFGPDATSSLLPSEIKQLVEFSENVQVFKNSIISKEFLFEQSIEMRRIFRKGIYWSMDMKKGEKVKLEHLLFRKPAMEIDSIDFESVLGKFITKEVFQMDPVRKTDISEMEL
jgi:N,N'-diacetyllegionaminate synthase